MTLTENDDRALRGAVSSRYDDFHEAHDRAERKLLLDPFDPPDSDEPPCPDDALYFDEAEPRGYAPDTGAPPPAPIHKRGDRMRAGSRPTAVIVDVDGTLDTARGLEWTRAQHRAGHVVIVVTARTHTHDYQRTHTWLRSRLAGVPFIGPICRAADDMRYACDFKLHVYQSLSLVYDIVAAIDDDRWVLETWSRLPGLEAVPCHPLRTHSRSSAAYQNMVGKSTMS